MSTSRHDPAQIHCLAERSFLRTGVCYRQPQADLSFNDWLEPRLVFISSMTSFFFFKALVERTFPPHLKTLNSFMSEKAVIIKEWWHLMIFLHGFLVCLFLPTGHSVSSCRCEWQFRRVVFHSQTCEHKHCCELSHDCDHTFSPFGTLIRR